MSTTTHTFQIGQRVVVVNPSGDLADLMGHAGTYWGDHRDGRLLVHLDANRCVYAFESDWLESEARTVTVTFTEAEAKLVESYLLGFRVLIHDDPGTSYTLLRRAIQKLQHARHPSTPVEPVRTQRGNAGYRRQDGPASSSVARQTQSR